MKRLKYYLLILCAGAFASCTDLDIPPKNIFNEQDIFGTAEGATSYIARLYGQLPMEDFRYSFQHGFNYSGTVYRQMCCATGEAVGRDTQSFFAEPGSNMWDSAYKAIREVNLFIQTLPNYKNGFTEQEYNTFLGEAYFIRAYFYFAMVKRLGGVPKIDYVIDYPANATLEDTWTPRASEEECWDFIGADLDLAIANLPDKNDSGRATRYAAAALKSRAMLYAGSIAKYNTVNEEYLGKRICGIPAERATDYFEAAYKASKIVDEGGYSLYKALWSADDREAQAENFTALFLDESENNTETIFARYYKEKFLTHDYDNSVQPRQTSTGGNDSEVSPSVDFIEMFEGIELDGEGHLKNFDDAGHYLLYDNPMDAFANAEPRLLGTVIFPMSKFKDQYIEIRRGIYTGAIGDGIDPLIKEGETAAYETLNIKDLQTTANFNGGPAVELKTPYTPYPGATPITSMNITGPNGPVNGWNFGNVGGTYLRKYLDPELENNSGGKSTQHWIDMRYAEVLLNRAEAAYELTQLGKTTAEGGESYLDEAFRCINLIRERAGATQLESASDLNSIDIVRRERRKELAFENLTYWDLRRWRIFYDEQNNTRYRILMPFFASEANKYFFDVRYTEPRGGYNYIFTYDTRYYYQPLPSGELGKNPNLKDNPGF